MERVSIADLLSIDKAFNRAIENEEQAKRLLREASYRSWAKKMQHIIICFHILCLISFYIGAICNNQNPISWIVLIVLVELLVRRLILFTSSLSPVDLQRFKKENPAAWDEARTLFKE